MTESLSSECLICFEEASENIVKCQPCQRAFHITCINEWLAHGYRCPNCREPWPRCPESDTAQARALVAFYAASRQPASDGITLPSAVRESLMQSLGVTGAFFSGDFLTEHPWLQDLNRIVANNQAPRDNSFQANEDLIDEVYPRAVDRSSTDSHDTQPEYVNLYANNLKLHQTITHEEHSYSNLNNQATIIRDIIQKTAISASSDYVAFIKVVNRQTWALSTNRSFSGIKGVLHAMHLVRNQVLDREIERRRLRDAVFSRAERQQHRENLWVLNDVYNENNRILDTMDPFTNQSPIHTNAVQSEFLNLGQNHVVFLESLLHVRDQRSNNAPQVIGDVIAATPPVCMTADYIAYVKAINEESSSLEYECRLFPLMAKVQRAVEIVEGQIHARETHRRAHRNNTQERVNTSNEPSQQASVTAGN